MMLLYHFDNELIQYYFPNEHISCDQGSVILQLYTDNAEMMRWCIGLVNDQVPQFCKKMLLYLYMLFP